ncbi:MAG: hypothetical protein R3C19_08835 [Planctomycetaceae bacterium]
MSTHLRQQQPAPRKVELEQSAKRRKPANAVAQPESAAVARSPRMSHLKQLRMMLDELILKADARDCLLAQGRDRYADRIPCDRDFEQLLSSLRDYVESHSGPEPQAATVSAADQNAVGEAPTVIRTTVGRMGVGRMGVGRMGKPGSTSRRRDRVRIQLKVSRPLAQILDALQKNKVRPGETIESILWESRRMKDLARLIGVKSH